MSDDEIAKAKGGEVVHVPMVLGAVAIAYHIPDFADTLNFDAALIADIFLGKITKWNDPRIAALNPSTATPDLPITVVHRTDGSGTTYVFTEFLTKSIPAWAAGPGHGKDVSWPVGLGGKGNEQVAGNVKSTPGAIGYVESVYAVQSRMSTGRVKNKAGNFVAPTPSSITAAAADVVASLPETTDYRISIVDPAREDAYPIASFTWLLVYRNQTDAAKATALKDFMKWAVTEGQSSAAELHYGPLPDSMRPGLLRHIESIRGQ
jgi:phosphate transport system substrate-binding protein